MVEVQIWGVGETKGILNEGAATLGCAQPSLVERGAPSLVTMARVEQQKGEGVLVGSGKGGPPRASFPTACPPIMEVVRNK